jgi:hypothetical protein
MEDEKFWDERQLDVKSMYFLIKFTFTHTSILSQREALSKVSY